jgi:hypothetical protein
MLETARRRSAHTMKCTEAMRWIAIAAGLTVLSACSIGKPMAIPEPESQLTAKPGLFSDDSGEWVIYRK